MKVDLTVDKHEGVGQEQAALFRCRNSMSPGLTCLVLLLGCISIYDLAKRAQKMQDRHEY